MMRTQKMAILAATMTKMEDRSSRPAMIQLLDRVSLLIAYSPHVAVEVSSVLDTSIQETAGDRELSHGNCNEEMSKWVAVVAVALAAGAAGVPAVSDERVDNDGYRVPGRPWYRVPDLHFGVGLAQVEGPEDYSAAGFGWCGLTHC
jgi:hypothetical protein